VKLNRRGKNGIFEAYYRHEGKRIRFSTGTANEVEAMRIAKKDFEDRVRGNLPRREEKLVTFKQLSDLLVLNYEKHRRRSLSTLKSQIKNLTRHFGLDLPADITSARVDQYVVSRRAEGAADQTINNELAALSAMFRCARDRTPPLMTYKPRIEKIKGIQNVRQGFFEHADFLRVMDKLPERYRPFVHFLYLTGTRKREAANIERRQVDWNGRVIKLEQTQTKNGRPRSLPIAGPIEAVVKTAWQRIDLRTPRLFHDEGHQINFGGASPFTKAWTDACVAAELPGRLVHDLRRTAIRNLLRGGNDPITVMNISGHRGMSVLERYDMRGEADLIAAAEKLATYLDSQIGKPKAPKVTKLRRRG
jgi:integrase